MVKLRNNRQTTTSQWLAYPGYGYPMDDGNWRLLVSGVVWQTPVVFTRRQKLMIRMLGNVMRATPEQMECDMFQNRITPFMAEADHRRSIKVTISGQDFKLRKKTLRNGHFKNWIVVSDEVVSKSATTQSNGNRFLPFTVTIDGAADTEQTKNPLAGDGRISLLNRKGLSVISDIDDTIKVSSVGDRRELLNNTFLRDFECVEGMVATYQQWAQLGASFHYVSSSPWQLYESLQNLLQKSGLPEGTMHLKNFRLREELFKKIMIKRKGKKSAIRSLLKKCPERDFLLIGDSGEKDPEIYRKICKKHPDRIKGLFIRELPFRPMEAERMQKLRDAMGDRPCETFSNGQDLAELGQTVFAARV